MTRATSYSDARQRLDELMNQAIGRREPVLIHQRGKEPVALVAAAELADWLETAAYPAKEIEDDERSRLARILDDLETAYLLCSPENARRLLEASDRAAAGEGESLSVEELGERFGLPIRDE
jgi:prevent-host-death family protein